MTGDRVWLGWQFALPHPDPGPRPRRPAPPEHLRVDPGWVAAQRREENLLNRPLKVVAVLAAAAGLVMLVAVIAGAVNVIVAALAIAVCVIAAGMSGAGIWQGEHALHDRVAAEQVRVYRFRADTDDKLATAQREHERLVRDWQARRFAFESQKRWYAVALPSGVERVDLAGGTLPGWSALATTLGAYRLASKGDGEMTVLDASGGSVAEDLIAVARGLGVDPLVWVLPTDLPRLDLTSGLDATGLADVLAGSAAAVADEASEPADAAVLERVIGVTGGARLDRVLAGLRTLAGIGDPLSDVRDGLLTADEVVALTTLYSRDSAASIAGARAWNLDAALRPLGRAGVDVPRLPRSRLRVLAVDPAAGDGDGAVLATFAAAALARLLRDAGSGAGPAWRHTLAIFGAERMRPGVLDRISDACAVSGTGLLLAFRTVPPEVRARLGRGNAAVAFMRLGNAEDAKAASEQLGSEHRFTLSQLTETAGASVTDTTGRSYTSTVSSSNSLARSVTVSRSAGEGRGRSAAAGPLPLAGSRSRERSRSTATSHGESVTDGISENSAWGVATSRATGASESVAASRQRSRELLVEPHELQQLPTTALVLGYASAAGRSVVLADVNPGIGSLDAATTTPLGEASLPSPGPRHSDDPDANLGPPPARLDWRRTVLTD
jgi:hypothetical protein